jgi:putative ABC transport system permease protein
MLAYSLRDLLREPRRALASVLGVALGVGLFAAIVLFVDASSATMTARAIAPLPLDMQAVLSSPLDPEPVTTGAPPRVSLEQLQLAVARVPGITAADRLAMVDLPPGALHAGGAALRSPVRVFAFDPGDRVHDAGVRITSGWFAPGSALLSVEASRALGAGVGSTVELTVPGRDLPVSVPVGGVADLSAAGSLFSSRVADSLGDFIYVPSTVVVSPDLFEGAILPALRADAASPSPVLRNAPILEVDARVDRSRLDADPATALVRTQGLTRSIERIAPGQAFVIDDLSTRLTLARGDAATGRVMFLFLGLPGVLLAGFLSAYAGGLLAQALRREHALLRTRGASSHLLMRLLAYRTMAVAGSGSALGLALGVIALGAVAGPGALAAVPGQDLLLLGLLAVAAGILTTGLSLYIPGRRALHREVAEEGRELERGGRAPWQRLWLDVALLAGAALVETVTYLGGGLAPTQVEGQSVSLSFYVLLAPLLGWFGATLLAVRLLLLVSPRLPDGGDDAGFGSLVGGALRRSLRRRSRAVASGVIGVGLALAFGFSVAIFIATYDAHKADEARFTVGADLRVTPSVLSPQPAGFAARLAVPGVVSATPADFHVGNATVGNDSKDLAAVDASSLGRTATLPDAFLVNGSAASALAAMRSDPAALLVDDEMARDFSIQVGDPVKVQLTDLSGAPVTVTFHAAGRFTQFPGFPQHVDVVANLGFYQAATGRTAADFFLVRTADRGDAAVARVASELRSGPGREVPLRIETTATAINRDQSTLAALDLHGLGSLDLVFMALMSATAVGIFVFGLMLQRRREYVTLRALGIRMGQLRALLLGEAGVVAVCGVTIGVLVGTGMAYLFAQILRPLFTLPVDRLTFPAGSMSGLAGLVLGAMALSALAAGVVLRRLEPVELLREE